MVAMISLTLSNSHERRLKAERQDVGQLQLAASLSDIDREYYCEVDALLSRFPALPFAL